MKLRTPRARRWANIVVAVAAAYAVGAAAWFPPELAAGGDNEVVRFEVPLYVTYALAGVLGFASLFVALRWSRVGQAMVVLAAVVMALSFLTLSRLSVLAVLSIGGTSAAFLLAAPFMGAMPRPEDEGKAY